MCKYLRVRPVVKNIVKELLAKHRSEGVIGLDDIAEVIDLRAVSYEEVDYIIERLEEAGMSVGEALSSHEVDVMRSVIVMGHRLSERLGRRPTVCELAASLGHPEPTVLRALDRASDLARRAIAKAV